MDEFFDTKSVWHAETNMHFDELDGVILEAIRFFDGLSSNVLTIDKISQCTIPSDMIAFLPIEGIVHFLPTLLKWLDNEEEGVDEAIFSVLAEDRVEGELAYMKKMLSDDQQQVVKSVLRKSIVKMIKEDGDLLISKINKARKRWDLKDLNCAQN